MSKKGYGLLENNFLVADWYIVVGWLAKDDHNGVDSVQASSTHSTITIE